MNTTNPYAMHERFKDRIHNPHNLPWEEFGDPTIWRPALKDEDAGVYNEFCGTGGDWLCGCVDSEAKFGPCDHTYRIRLSDRPWPEVDGPASPWHVSSHVAAAILRARDAHTEGDMSAVYHELYRIADPEFSSFDPWKRLEEIAGDLHDNPLPEAPEVDPIPVGYHAATEAEMLALPKGYLVWCDTSVARTWVAGANPGEDVRYSGLSFACPDAPVEAAEEWVQLEASDVPPGSVFRHRSWKSVLNWIQAIAVTDEGVYVAPLDDVSFGPKSFMDLRTEHWMILRPGQEWMPCRKLKEGGV